MIATIGDGVTDRAGMTPLKASRALGDSVSFVIFDQEHGFPLEEGRFAQNVSEGRERPVVVEVDVQGAHVCVLVWYKAGGQGMWMSCYE